MAVDAGPGESVQPGQASTGDRGGLFRALGRGGAALLVVGLVFTSMAAVSLWAWRTFVSSEGFADVATDMLHDPDVRTIVSQQIVSTLAEQPQAAKLTAAGRPVLEGAVAAIVATSAFQGIFHAGVTELHADIVSGSRTRLLVQVNDTPAMVRDGLERVNSSVADAIPEGALTVGVGLSQSTPVDTVIRVAEVCGWIALPLALAALACCVGVVVQARERRRAVEAIGWGLIVLGLLQFALLYVGGGIASRMGGNELEGHVLRAMFWSITNLLSIQSTLIITAGAVLAMAGAYSGTGQLQVRAKAAYDSLWRRLSEPGWKAAASLALIGVAVLAMVWPSATAAVVVRVLAFSAFVAGAAGLLDLVGNRHWATTGPVAARLPIRRLAMASVGGIVAICAVLFFGGLSFLKNVRSPQAKHARMSEEGCNGHLPLCSKTIDQVVFAGTHNAMSALAEAGWLYAHQSGGLGAQLSAGVRAFMLDLHYGWQAKDGGLVRTDLVAEGALGPSEVDASPDAIAQAKGLLAFGGFQAPPGESKVYFCHNYCEYGHTKAVDGFREIRDWLRENPNEVIILDLEDHVSARDAASVLEQSGLADLAYTWTPGTPMPTLGHMIQAKRNVLVMGEYHWGSAPAWYLDAYKSVLRETPYRFTSAAEFSCAEKRGLSDNPLLLVNHWIENGPADSVTAGAVNTSDVLEKRAETCAQQRNHVPNILAVDFYAKGDLFEVVNDLNGVGTAPADQGPTAGQ